MAIIKCLLVFIFNGSDYTVMAWVYLRACNYYSRLIDVGNGKSSDNIVFSVSAGTTCLPNNLNLIGGNQVFSVRSQSKLQLNKWQHLSFTFCASKIAYVYINGLLTGNETATIGVPKNIMRQTNFVGRSNFLSSGDGDVNAILDEIKIFHKSLSQKEIQFEMNNELFF